MDVTNCISCREILHACKMLDPRAIFRRLREIEDAADLQSNEKRNDARFPVKIRLTKPVERRVKPCTR